MTNLKRGDVVLVWFPNSDLSTFKRRPALVVQADNLKTGISQVILVLITSNLGRRGHPSRIYIPLHAINSEHSGLRADSIIMTDNLATVLWQAIAQKLGSLDDLSAVDAALRITLAL